MENELFDLHPLLKGSPQDVIMALVKAGAYLNLSEIAIASSLSQEEARRSLRILERIGFVVHMDDAGKWIVHPSFSEAHQAMLKLHGPDTVIGRQLRK